MNKKGQVWGYSLMLGLTVIILALALAPAGKSFIDSAMGTSTADFIGLDCDTTTSNFIKGTCIITDFSLVYFFGGLIMIGGGVITTKLFFD
jgi:hypothetical protein